MLKGRLSLSKAVENTKSKSMNVVCRLVGFHLLMSFLGSIRIVMECYDAAVHIFSGKAYVRALRAHFLVKSTLELITLQFITPLSLIEHLSTYDVDGEYLSYAG